MKLCLSYALLIPTLFCRCACFRHKVLLLQLKFSVFINWVLCILAVLGCNWKAFSQKGHEWISFKLSVFCLFLIPTLHSPSEHTSSSFSGKAVYIFPLIYTYEQFEQGWNWTSFSEKVSQMNLNETLPVISVNDSHSAPKICWFHHAQCFCYNKLFDFHELSFAYACRVSCNLRAFSEQMQNGFPWNSRFFPFTTLPLCHQYLSTLPLLGPLTCKLT